jgi:hypothetical protein
MNYSQLYQTIQSYAENYDNSPGGFIDNIPVFVQNAEQRIYNNVQLPSLRRNSTGTITANNQYLSAPADFLASFSLAVIDPVTNEYLYLLNKDVNFMRQSYPNPTDTGKPEYYALFGPQYTDNNELSFILGPTPNIDYQAELHYYYYPPTIVQGVINGTNTLAAGTLYTNGYYENVSLFGGSGSGATADILVSGNVVTSCIIRNGGSFYAVSDVLGVTNADIGGTGSGFSISVASISNANGTSWLGDNFDSVLLYGSLLEAGVFMKSDADVMTVYKTRYDEALSLLKRLGDGLERGDAYRNGQTKLQYNKL